MKSSMFTMVRGMGLAAVVAAFTVSANAATLTQTSIIGGFNYAGSGGALGYIFGPAVAGRAGVGTFGAQFAGPALVNSLTIDQLDSGRKRPNEVRVYTAPGIYTTVYFADTQAPQTVDFTAFNGGQPIAANNSFLMLAVISQYGTSDPNFGIMPGFSFDGTYVGPADVNLNASATMSSQNPWGDPSNQPASIANNGQIASLVVSDGTYWTRNASPHSLTATYSAAQNVGSIGLGWTGNVFATTDRDLPRFITVSDSHGNSEVVTLAPLFPAQYMRYTLTTPFLDTTSLTITFPDGSNTANWYINGDSNFGMTEFQAFASTIPEPATLALMALGGLLIASRRRR